jgi:hypothetical protein
MGTVRGCFDRGRDGFGVPRPPDCVPVEQLQAAHRSTVLLRPLLSCSCVVEAVLALIADGTVTVTFRRWKRPQAVGDVATERRGISKPIAPPRWSLGRSATTPTERDTRRWPRCRRSAWRPVTSRHALVLHPMTNDPRTELASSESPLTTC